MKNTHNLNHEGTKDAKKQKNGEISLDVLGGVPAVAPVDPWVRARQWVDNATRFERCKVACQLMAGFDLLELRSEHGTNQGKRRDLQKKSTSPNDLEKFTSPNDSEKLDWPELVKQRLGISDETARNWMRMADAAKPKLKKLGGTEMIAAILEKPAAEWDTKEAETLSSAVHKITDGKTQLEFMFELGIAKKPQGSGARGNAGNGGSGSGGTEASDVNTGDQKIEGDTHEEQEAIAIWKPIIEEIELEGLKENSWGKLPDQWKKRLKGAVVDLNTRIK